MKKINLAEKFSLFDEHWTPKVLAESNEQLVKIAKGQGELVWHQHDDADELFIVFKGRLTIKLESQDIVLNVGEMFIVPKGVQHCPYAEEETHFLMIEPKSVINTGESSDERRLEAEDLDWI